MKIPLILVFIFLFGLGFYFVSNRNASQKIIEIPIEEKIDYRASFAIFTNGTFRDFSSSKYHNQSKDVFTQSDNPNIIYVKKKGITWNDFFKTLPMGLSKDCLTTGTGQKFCTNEDGSLKFYLNGKRDDNVLSKEIKNGDQALITYGNESEEEIKEQFQKIPKAQNLVSFIFYGIILST